MGFDKIFDIGAVVADWLSPKRSIARIRKEIRRGEDEISNLIKNPCNDANRKRIGELQSKLAGLHRELQDNAN